MLKFKMKLSYECWVQNLTIQRLMLQAVKKTVYEINVLSIHAMRKAKNIDEEDGIPPYNQSMSESSIDFSEEDAKEEAKEVKRKEKRQKQLEIARDLHQLAKSKDKEFV